MKINHTLTMIKFILCLQDLDCPELLIIYDFELFLNEGVFLHRPNVLDFLPSFE